MKYSLFALAAACTAVTGVSARHNHMRRHNAHADLFARYQSADAACSCSTYVTTRVHAITVTPSAPVSTVTVVPVYEESSSAACHPGMPGCDDVETEAPAPTSTAGCHPGSYGCPDETPVPTVASEIPVETPDVPAPTPEVTTYTATGTYTIPAHTVTITNTLTTVIPVVTTLTMGPNTYGGVTTVVESATTVTCPYATVETTGDVTTSKIISTTYVCPSAGTYTVGATTSTVTETDVVPCTYAAPAVYTPGTYTQTEAVVTITKTSQVVVCPYETGSPSIPAPTYAAPPKETSTTEESAPAYTPKAVKPSTSAPAYEAPATTSAPVVKSKAPAYSAPEVVESSTKEYSAPAVESSTKEIPSSTKEAPSSTKETSTPESTGSHSNVPTAGGDLWSIAYSPFKVGGCLDKSTIEADIADIASKGFKNIRVYSPECGTLSSVADACAANGIKMIVGIQIDARGDSFYEDQVSQYEKWAKWELVETVVVGNECMFNGFCTVDDLVSKIKDVRTRFSGYTGPVTTADTVGNFETATKGNSALCDAIDIIGVNIQVYFDGGRTAEMAGEFLKTQMAQASACCPDKETYVFEAGWPTVGQSQGVAVASKTNQATALKGFMAAAPGKISYFTYRDDEWKPPGNLGIEQHYGCGDFF